jgi:hypothetical protein
VHPLLQRRSPGNILAGSLQWPSVGADLSVCLEAGEVIRWSGLMYVAELRYGGKQDPRWDRVWTLVGQVPCVITDRRISYRGEKVVPSTDRWAAVAARIEEPDSAGEPSILAGQVRFQWPAGVLLTRTKHDVRILKALSQAVGTGSYRAGRLLRSTTLTHHAAAAGMAMNNPRPTAAACRGLALAIANHGWRGALIRWTSHGPNAIR